MKIRKGFVSNSSSSSFVIEARNLSEKQIEQIMDHGSICQLDYEERWDVDKAINEFNARVITGYVFMDNFDMHKYLTKYVHVDEDQIKWDEYRVSNCRSAADEEWENAEF